MKASPNWTRKTGLILGLGALMLSCAALAQEYPTRPVKIVVSYPPGATTDALARLIGQQLAKRINQPVVVENKPGASGMIGAKAVSDAAPDGNTLLMYTSAWPAQKIFVKKPLVAVPEGLEPVTLVATGRLILTAPQALPAKSFNELVAYAKANPGMLNYSTTGPGDPLLDFEIMKSDFGIKMEAIQYKGAAPQLNALLTNDVQLALQPEFTILHFVKEGKLKVLAVTGDKRSNSFPDAPTFIELGLPKIHSNWMALFAPKGTPAPLVEKLNADLAVVIKSPEVSQRIRDIYFEPVGSSADQLKWLVQADINEWTAIAKTAGIRPE